MANKHKKNVFISLVIREIILFDMPVVNRRYHLVTTGWTILDAGKNGVEEEPTFLW